MIPNLKIISVARVYSYRGRNALRLCSNNC